MPRFLVLKHRNDSLPRSDVKYLAAERDQANLAGVTFPPPTDFGRSSLTRAILLECAPRNLHVNAESNRGRRRVPPRCHGGGGWKRPDGRGLFSFAQKNSELVTAQSKDASRSRSGKATGFHAMRRRRVLHARKQRGAAESGGSKRQELRPVCFLLK